MKILAVHVYGTPLHELFLYTKNPCNDSDSHTFQVLCLELLTAGLVLKLVVLTDETVTEGALEDPAAMIPHTSVTLNAGGIRQWARAGMTGETLATMTHPGLTEVTNGTLKGGRDRNREREKTHTHIYASWICLRV